MKLTPEQASSHLSDIESDIREFCYMAGIDEDVREEYMQALQMGADALALQEPKKPRETEYKNPEIPNAKTEQILICPKCESFIGYAVDCKDENYQYNYCNCCGQKLNWESDN